MDGTRKFVEQDQLTSLVRATFGPTRHLNAVARLRGGSKKGVYRLVFDDESTVILYIWGDEENYWPKSQESAGSDRADPFSDASGFDLFEASHACLNALGIRTPQVYFLDRSKSHFPADLAGVEDVHGGTLEALLQHNPQGAERTLAGLSTALQRMQQHRSRRLGKVALVGSGDGRQDRSCEQIVLDRAARHLAEVASRVERVAIVRAQLEEKIHELAGAVRPRTEYSLIHGELGPDHVLVDERGDPVLIDIEGVMFFDVEWEHVFLHLRFGEHYRWLRSNDLDEQRMQFYALAMHLSLVAGPLRLLDGDFPDREFMMGIAEYNLQRALTFLQ
jgi:Phosphotransferase enzyme family